MELEGTSDVWLAHFSPSLQQCIKWTLERTTTKKKHSYPCVTWHNKDNAGSEHNRNLQLHIVNVL